MPTHFCDSNDFQCQDGKGERVHVAALEELLRFWVAFSVVDEDGLGTVSVADLKVQSLSLLARARTW